MALSSSWATAGPIPAAVRGKVASAPAKGTRPRRACVAGGHPATVAAAVEALAAGGTAVDAAVAAGFAAAVAEPTMTGLAGGGFLLARTPAGDEVVFDFFVDTPGKGAGATPPSALDFVPVCVRFSVTAQQFHVGLGSVAVPGCLPGYLHAHRRLGRLPLDQVLAPARRLAEAGVPLNHHQAALVRLFEPILSRTPEAAEIFLPGGRLPSPGDRLRNPALAAFLARIDERGFATPAIAGAITTAMASGGRLSAEDLACYQVAERAPLELRWRGRRLLTNPPPAFGGELVALGLALVEEQDPRPTGPRPGACGSAGADPIAHALGLAGVSVAVEKARAAGRAAVELGLRSSAGTTHVSVSDAEGGVAAMTTSNGVGSGWVVPGTGVLANNMLGEEDLHPEGFHRAQPGQRVSSMMAPSLLVGPDGEVELVVGSGGSKRIRSALVQAIEAAAGQRRPLSEAVVAPRLHWDGQSLQVEPGWPEEVLAAFAQRYPLRVWPAPDLYFGGVNAVIPGRCAVGDPRRGGAAWTG